MSYHLAIVSPTPNWHYPEFYSRLAAHESIELTMLFCSRKSLDGALLREKFGEGDRSWGTDLLGNYNYKFMRNYPVSRLASTSRERLQFVNPGIWRELRAGKYDVVIIEMWNDVTFLLAGVSCKIQGIPFFYTGDATILTERSRPRWLRLLKKAYLGRFLFSMATGLLYRTALNRKLYESYSVPDEKMYSFPLSVDALELQRIHRQHLETGRDALRRELGIPSGAFAVLYVGRLSPEKRVQDLIKAYLSLEVPNKSLYIVGGGPFKSELEVLINNSVNPESIHLAGFKGKKEVAKFYTVADILVLPSEMEPHGAVVKEAMCFGLPVIVSDKVGSSADVVLHGENGFIYPCGEIPSLSKYLEIIEHDRDKRIQMSKKANQIAEEWDHDKTISQLISTLESILTMSS